MTGKKFRDKHRADDLGKLGRFSESVSGSCF